MRVKEKEGTNIEFTCGTLGELFEHLEELFEVDKKYKEDIKLFKKIAKLFDSQTIKGQQVTIESLLEKFKLNISASIKEELKEDANS